MVKPYPLRMRAFLPWALTLTIASLAAVPAPAQGPDRDSPMVIPPPDAPEGFGSESPMIVPPPDELPAPPGDFGAEPPSPDTLPDDQLPPDADEPPMVIPPPDEPSPPAPEAFGSEPPESGEALPGEDGASRAGTPEERLDELFTELKREADADKAAMIAARIEREWRRSGSATVDLLMLWAGQAMGRSNNAAALDFLDQALVLAPDYAEAWNRRATLNFSMENYGKSIADIEQTLLLEPRHFGALMGLGMILEQIDRKEEALEAYMRALEVYPTLKSAQDAVGRLSDELSGRAI